MLALALHPRGWHRPDLVREVDLRPLRTYHFAGAGCAQNQKLQRPRRNGVLRPQRHHESWHIAVVHGLVVDDWCQLPFGRQHLIKVTFPSRGIGPWWPVPPRDAPVEDLLDAGSGAISSDGFGFPDAFE